MREIHVKGIVQGVGFRPFVCSRARELGLVGYVQNVGGGVKIVTDNEDKILEVLKSLPELARVDSFDVMNYLGNESFSDFSIRYSEKVSSYSPIPADLNICKNCVEEMFDKSNFRYKYFFVSCTNCGPRFSIVNKTPYDRINTTLDKFEMCDNCFEEYSDINNRRFHAQTVACSKCGPKLSLYNNGKKIDCENPIKQVAKLLKQNEIVAIKGVGGFHLVCNAKKNTVKKLKELTRRHYKPFGLMGKDIDMIEKFCKVSDKEKEIINSNKRPIVLLEKKDKNALLWVSEISSLGFMLPYTGLHYLLFEYIDEPLIFTSSNMPSFPITLKKEEQFTTWVLDYNREIANTVDDSIIKVIDEKPLIIRRSRGYVPNEINITSKYQTIDYDLLSFGAELKSTFCIKKENKLILSQHMGNTYNLKSFEMFKNYLPMFLEFVSSKTKLVFCDYNDSFNTSIFCEEFSKKKGIKMQKVQHHVAHGFSVAMEHNIVDFIAIVCDGSGFGLDKKVWGGEVFYNDKRIGRLEYHNLVGGDIASKEPVRFLVSILSKFLSEKEIFDTLKDFDKHELGIFYKMNIDNFNCIESSSCGRVLDAFACFLGIADKNFYEGRCSMILESVAKDCDVLFEPEINIDDNGLFVLNTTKLFKFAYENLNKISLENLAWIGHIYIAKGLYEIARRYDKKLPVVFSGGVSYNKWISSYLMKNGVLFNNEIPPGDGGISAGQIAWYLWKIGKNRK